MTTTLSSVPNNAIHLIHASPGRIRLRVRGQEFNATVDQLRQQIDDLQIRLDIQAHATNSSVILQFDPNEVALEHLLSQLSLAPQTIEEDAQTLSEELGKASSLLRTVLPFLSGYAVVRLLGLSGWVTLPAFLLSDLMTCEVLNQVMPSQTQEQDDSHVADSDQLEEAATQSHLADLIQAAPSVPAVLSIHALAERLRVSVTTISRNKSKANFVTWSSSHDPDGIAWQYLKKTKEFVHQ